MAPKELPWRALTPQRWRCVAEGRRGWRGGCGAGGSVSPAHASCPPVEQHPLPVRAGGWAGTSGRAEGCPHPCESQRHCNFCNCF